MWKIIRRPLEIVKLDGAARAVGDSVDEWAFRFTGNTRRDVARPDPGTLPCPFFIVLAPYRSGTNLLIRSMNDLEGCTVFSELFNPNGPLFGPPVLTEWNKDPALRRERNRDPLGFLERRVLAHARPEMRALGFKLMYEEARWGAVARVRRWLARHRSIRVVHLVRAMCWSSSSPGGSVARTGSG